MQDAVDILQQHALVSVEPDRLEVRLRLRHRAFSMFQLFVVLLSGGVAPGLLWIEGASVPLYVFFVGWVLGLLYTVWGLVRPERISVQLTPHTLRVGRYEAAWDEIEGVSIINEGENSFLQVQTKAAVNRRHVFWAPPQAQEALLAVVRSHIAQHRPAVQPEHALPAELRALQAAGRE